MDEVKAHITRLRRAKGAERDEIRAALMALAKGPEGSMVQELLADLKRGEVLEVQWELEEILEELNPPAPEPEPEPEPPPKAKPPGQVTAADLQIVYQDPNGNMVHRTKDHKRWFLTQSDPMGGPPQTFELQPHEVPQIKAQLQGSPYWILGG